MPYIKEDQREAWDQIVEGMNLDPGYVSVGDLNY